mgnify:FL=1
MKKVIVAILLVLPFLLIYFISFTGQILSKYTHIAVERITVLNEVGDEYKEDDIIKIGLNDEFDLKVKVYPELASNKAVKIVNSDNSICQFDEGNLKVKGIQYGFSTFVITSVDKPSVRFQIIVQVAHDKLENFKVFAFGKEITFDASNTSTETISVTMGKTISFGSEIVPTTTLPIYRTLIWTSNDRTILQVTQNGKATAIAEGTVTLQIKSKKINDDDLEIVKYVKIKVHPLSDFFGVGFDVNSSTGDIVMVTDEMLDADGYFDLLSITKIGADALEAGITKDKLQYRIESGSAAFVDASQLVSGKIAFLQSGKSIVIKLFVVGETEPRDTITLKRGDSPAAVGTVPTV